MRPRILIPALAALLALAAARPAEAQQTAYSIGEGGTSLITYSTSSPGTVARVGGFTLDGAPAFLDAIDFRPATGQLYGYSDLLDSYFIVDRGTAGLIPVGGGSSTNTFFLGMDFNPTIDRLRVVTESAQNIVFNPVAGSAAPFTDLFYVANDPNEGTGALVIENAYTKNVAGLGQPTVQYVLDYGLDILATLNNNTGELRTVGALGFDFTEYAGFDIFTTAGGVDTAYALLTPVGGAPSLYTINLDTGAATPAGAIGGNFGPVYGLAVVPVPEPGSVALLATGLAGLGLLALRRRRA